MDAQGSYNLAVVAHTQWLCSVSVLAIRTCTHVLFLIRNIEDEAAQACSHLNLLLVSFLFKSCTAYSTRDNVCPNLVAVQLNNRMDVDDSCCS